jgi:hypothetical protein
MSACMLVRGDSGGGWYAIYCVTTQNTFRSSLHPSFPKHLLCRLQSTASEAHPDRSWMPVESQHPHIHCADSSKRKHTAYILEPPQARL